MRFSDQKIKEIEEGIRSRSLHNATGVIYQWVREGFISPNQMVELIILSEMAQVNNS